MTVASRNTSVRNASRIDSAISFGVLPRLAPSTIAIMRSRNASPGLLVTRTTSQSDSTRVPPVTEQKSPPASRSTGADSPVMALSSTDATPSMTSPSAGMTSRASTSTTSSRRSEEAWTRVWPSSARRPLSFFACTSLRVERSAAAWALPRPSATASAKFANSTVSHSQAAIVQHESRVARRPAPCPSAAATPSAVVRMLPTNTTNITGLRTCTRGSSLAKESRIALQDDRVRLQGGGAGMCRSHLNGSHQLEVFDDRPERERGQERERADQQHRGHQHDDEQRRVRGQACPP